MEELRGGGKRTPSVRMGELEVGEGGGSVTPGVRLRDLGGCGAPVGGEGSEIPWDGEVGAGRGATQGLKPE